MNRQRRLLLLGLAGGLAACAGPAPRRESPELEALRHRIVLEALGQIGRPYRLGGATPEGFDCSGLTQYVYAQADVRLPRTAREQHRASRRIDLSEALPADLLFYRFSGRAVDHVAVYLGDGQAVHAPASGRAVIVAAVDLPYWQRRFADAARFLGQ